MVCVVCKVRTVDFYPVSLFLRLKFGVVVSGVAREDLFTFRGKMRCEKGRGRRSAVCVSWDNALHKIIKMTEVLGDLKNKEGGTSTSN